MYSNLGLSARVCPGIDFACNVSGIFFFFFAGPMGHVIYGDHMVFYGSNTYYSLACSPGVPPKDSSTSSWLK